MAVISGGAQQRVHRHVKPPPAKQGTDLESQGAVIANAVPAGGLGLYLQGCLISTVRASTQSAPPYGSLKKPDICCFVAVKDLIDRDIYCG